MKNWRKILVTGMVAGMVAVTGCSSNLPETNQGNRNGQRVVDAVNRRTDSYGLTRSYNTGPRTLRGFNRGFRRAARNDRNAGTRHYNHIAHRGLGVDGNNHYRHPGSSTVNNIPNRSTNTLNRGRVGHTFGYDQYGHMNGIDGEYSGYDLGQRAGTRINNTAQNNAANLNNRVVRSTPARNVTRNTNTTTTKAVHPTRKATHTKAVQPTRSATRSTQPKHTTTHTARPTTTAKPSATIVPSTTTRGNAGNVTHPMLHNTHNVGSATHATPARSIANRQGTRSLSTRTERSRELRQNRPTRSLNANIGPVAPIMNANPIVNPSATRGLTHARSYNKGYNRSQRRAANRTINRASRPHNVNINDFNLTHRGINNSMRLGPDFYMSNNDVNGVYGGLPFNGYSSVPVSMTDDGDYAFFKRNKTNNEETPPAAPAPPSGPQAPSSNRSNRVNPVQTAPTPAPTQATPVPTSMTNDWDGNAYDNAYDYDNTHDYDNATDNYYNNYVPPAQHRAMK